MDNGRWERVSSTCLQPLLAENFRMPSVTYACALFGVSESSSGCWSQRQIHELRALLLGKPENVRIKALMSRIQAYRNNCTTPYEWNNYACLAKYSEDGKWYRAVITSEVCMDGVQPEGISVVDVDYVHFGNKESVSVNDL